MGAEVGEHALLEIWRSREFVTIVVTSGLGRGMVERLGEGEEIGFAEAEEVAAVDAEQAVTTMDLGELIEIEREHENTIEESMRFG